MAMSTVTNGLLKLPAEIWAQIFHHLESPENEVASLRLICKAWRDIIDDNCYFHAIVNDKKYDISRLLRMRVMQCTVATLVTPISLTPNFLFLDHKHLTTLSLAGQISRKNFMSMVSQFTHVTHLTVKYSFFFNPQLLVPSTSDEEINLKRFLAKLKFLKVTMLSIKRKYSTICAKQFYSIQNYLRLLSSDMPKLQTFDLFVIEFNIDDSALFPFLMERTPKLETLKVTCMSEYTVPTGGELTTPLAFKPLHLRSFELNVRKGRGFGNWMPLLRPQRSLEKLHLFGTYGEYYRLYEVLNPNRDTLEYLEGDFYLPEPLNACQFTAMHKLKKVVFTFEGHPASIVNLCLLPQSTKILKLDGFTPGTFTCREIQMTIETLKNLKYFKLGQADESELINILHVGKENFFINRRFKNYGHMFPSLVLVLDED